MKTFSIILTISAFFIIFSHLALADEDNNNKITPPCYDNFSNDILPKNWEKMADTAYFQDDTIISIAAFTSSDFSIARKAANHCADALLAKTFAKQTSPGVNYYKTSISHTMGIGQHWSWNVSNKYWTCTRAIMVKISNCVRIE